MIILTARSIILRCLINIINTYVYLYVGTATDSRWTKPQSEILDGEVLVDFGNNATFACKVTGYPAPNILWEDDKGLNLPSEVPKEY